MPTTTRKIYQVNYDRRAADASNWERLNFILRNLQQEQAKSVISDAIDEAVASTAQTVQSAAAAAVEAALPDWLNDLYSASAITGPDVKFLSWLWAMANGEKQGYVTKAAALGVPSGAYVSALASLGTAIGGAKELSAIAPTQPGAWQTIITAVGKWADERSKLISAMIQRAAELPLSEAPAGADVGDDEMHEWLQCQIWDLEDAVGEVAPKGQDDANWGIQLAEEALDEIARERERIDELEEDDLAEWAWQLAAEANSFDIGSSSSSNLFAVGDGVFLAQPTVSPYTFPDINGGNPYYVQIYAKGGGGGGESNRGSGDDRPVAGGGGGEGETVKWMYWVTPGDTMSFTIGAGGAKGNNSVGGTGGSTTFTVQGHAAETAAGGRGGGNFHQGTGGKGGGASYVMQTATGATVWHFAGQPGSGIAYSDSEDSEARSGGGCGGGQGGGVSQSTPTGWGCGGGGSDDGGDRGNAGSPGVIVVTCSVIDAAGSGGGSEPLSASITDTVPSVPVAGTYTATVTASGGTSPYAYAWTSTPSVITSGAATQTCTFTVTDAQIAAGIDLQCVVTDANGGNVTVYDSVQYIPPPPTVIDPLSAVASDTVPSPPAAGTYAATCVASGGTGGYTYAWTATNATITGGAATPVCTFSITGAQVNSGFDLQCVATDSSGSSITVNTGASAVYPLVAGTNVTLSPSSGDLNSGPVTISAAVPVVLRDVYYDSSTGVVTMVFNITPTSVAVHPATSATALAGSLSAYGTTMTFTPTTATDITGAEWVVRAS